MLWWVTVPIRYSFQMFSTFMDNNTAIPNYTFKCFASLTFGDLCIFHKIFEYNIVYWISYVHKNICYPNAKRRSSGLEPEKLR